MKANPVNVLIAILAAALLAYGLWNLAAREIKDAIGFGSFVFLASALVCTMGLRFGDERVGQSVKLLGSLFFVVALAINLFFSLTGFSATAYLITSGLLFLLFLFLASTLHNAEQA